MNYIIIEQQTDKGTTAVLTQTKDNINEAEQAYHTVLAYASVSTIDTHSATMLNENGQALKYECFNHRAEE